jgi:hypothetical protein
VRDYAKTKGVAEGDAAAVGMSEKSAEFRRGGEIYLTVKN